MKLGKALFFGLALASAGCGDDPIPLQVDFGWTTFCDPDGCPTRDQELIGKNGAAIVNLAGAVLGVECEITEQGDTTIVTSLKVQDRPVSAMPNLGINVFNGRLAVGSSMSCAADGFSLFDENQFDGGCAGPADGHCQIAVNEYTSNRGRMVLEIVCQNLVPVAGDTPRSLENGLLTIEGCHVTEDNR